MSQLNFADSFFQLISLSIPPALRPAPPATCYADDLPASTISKNQIGHFMKDIHAAHDSDDFIIFHYRQQIQIPGNHFEDYFGDMLVVIHCFLDRLHNVFDRPFGLRLHRFYYSAR